MRAKMRLESAERKTVVEVNCCDPFCENAGYLSSKNGRQLMTTSLAIFPHQLFDEYPAFGEKPD
ncbi:MAG: hypothetical protein ACR2PF_14125, partial [Rhizobiaceae bacterium]